MFLQNHKRIAWAMYHIDIVKNLSFHVHVNQIKYIFTSRGGGGGGAVTEKTAQNNVYWAQRTALK